MADMVTNLLDMARIQSGGIRLRLDWQSVEEIVGGAVKSRPARLGQRRASVHIDPGVPLVECDAVLIERVLVNLLENAGKYTPRRRRWRSSCARPMTSCWSACATTGPGVRQGPGGAIFEKFTRGDAESATPGVGLGLAICRAIVEAHRGRIWVEPTQPQGATFTFSLPLRHAAGARPGR